MTLKSETPKQVRAEEAASSNETVEQEKEKEKEKQKGMTGSMDATVATVVSVQS